MADAVSDCRVVTLAGHQHEPCGDRGGRRPRRGRGQPEHIRALEDAALVRRHRLGRTTILALKRAPLQQLRAWVDQFHPEWGTDEESLANDAEHLRHEGTVPKESA